MNKKQIRRLLSPAICVLIAAASCLTAFAAANTLTIEECDDLQITLPDNMTAVTRSSESDASYYTDHNLSYVDVQEAFLNGDIYMQAMDDDNAVTLTMSYLETDAKDFTDLTDDKLSEVARGFVASINSEVQYDSSTCDETDIATPWIFFNMSVKDQDGNVSRQYQATTVKNGKNVTLNLYRNGGDVEESDYAVIESVARTVKLNATPFYKNRRFWLYVGGAVFLIALIVLIIVIVKSAKNHTKKTKNDKILEELAGKYTTRQGAQVYYDDGDEYVDVSQSGYVPPKDKKPEAQAQNSAAQNSAAQNSAAQSRAAQNSAAQSRAAQNSAAQNSAAQNSAAQSRAAQTAQAADSRDRQAEAKSRASEPTGRDVYSGSAQREPLQQKKTVVYTGFYGADEPKRKYSDEDIDRLLGDLEDDENFDYTLPVTEADSEDNSEVWDSVTKNADGFSEAYDDEPSEDDYNSATAAEKSAESAHSREEERLSGEAPVAEQDFDDAYSGKALLPSDWDHSEEAYADDIDKADAYADEQNNDDSFSDDYHDEPDAADHGESGDGDYEDGSDEIEIHDGSSLEEAYTDDFYEGVSDEREAFDDGPENNDVSTVIRYADRVYKDDDEFDDLYSIDTFITNYSSDDLFEDDPYTGKESPFESDGDPGLPESPDSEEEDTAVFESATPEKAEGDTTVFKSATPEKAEGDTTVFKSATPEKAEGDTTVFKSATPEKAEGDTTVFKRATPEKAEGGTAVYKRVIPEKTEGGTAVYKRVIPEKTEGGTAVYKRVTPVNAEGDTAVFERVTPVNAEADAEISNSAFRVEAGDHKTRSGDSMSSKGRVKYPDLKDYTDYIDYPKEENRSEAEKPKPKTPTASGFKSAFPFGNSGDEDFEEYLNDEVLAREDSRQEKFRDSNDFFEGVSGRLFSALNRRDAEYSEEAEDTEAPEKAKGDEKPRPYPIRGFAKGVKNFRRSVKGFGTHCGYFAKNVKLSVKRKHINKKIKKAESNRREPERRKQAQAMQERRRAVNGLVKVHSRGETKLPQQKRPAQQGGRPQQSKPSKPNINSQKSGPAQKSKTAPREKSGDQPQKGRPAQKNKTAPKGKSGSRPQNGGPAKRGK